MGNTTTKTKQTEKRWLLIGDIHEGYKRTVLAAKLAKKEKRDVISNGDYLADWHSSDDVLLSRFDMMMEPFSESRVYCVNGNHDPDQVYLKAVKKYSDSHIDLRQKLVEYDDLAIVGFGGREVKDPKKSGSGSPHGYDTIYKSLESNIKDAKEKGYKEADIALLIHEPPKGYLDKVRNGYHIGGNAARDIVEKYDVGLVISGHTHTDVGIEVRVREGGTDHRLRMRPERDIYEEYDFHGAKIISDGQKFNVSYDPNSVALTCFANPGTLGYSNEYARLDIKNSENLRELSFDFAKL